MNNDTILGALDPELTQDVASRREVIRNAGALGAKLALASIPLGIAAMAKTAFSQTALPTQIVNALNFALILEELEAEFFTIGTGGMAMTGGTVAAGLVPGRDRPIFDTIRDHEQDHVRFLRGVLGAQAVAKPTFDFTGGRGSNAGPFADVFTNYATFQALAQAFEDTGVRAYKGQAPELFGNKDVLERALEIHSVEARHASMVRRLRGNFTETAPQKGWITGNQRGTGMPAATQPIYDGEENVLQGAPPAPAPGLNVQTLNFAPTGVAAVTPAVAAATAASEAFDEPLTRAQVVAIVQPFIVQTIS